MIYKRCKGIKLKSIVISIIASILLIDFLSVNVYAEENVVNEIKDILNKYYIEDISQDVLSEDTIDDIFMNLNDPYTQIINENDFSSYVDSSYFGIGVTIEMTKEGALVKTIIVNSPAMDSGLKEGDIIILVNDKYLQGLSVNTALDILNGKPDVLSKLVVIRNGDLLVIEIMPKTIYYPTIYSKIINNHIAYIHIMYFGENTLDEFRYKINSLKMESVDSFIIDLRVNPGGYIYSAIEIAGYFVRDNTVALAKNKYGTEFKFKATKKDKIISKPTIFLVNKYTASAAELLIACIQDYNVGIIIGETTNGKGVVQSTFKLSDGNVLKATTLKLYSPKGREFNKKGVSPDLHFVNVDNLIAGQFIIESQNMRNVNSKISKVTIKNKEYYIDMSKINNVDLWEIYRQIIDQATSIYISNYSPQNSINEAYIKNYPVINYVEVPKTQYKAGERIFFQINAPNYNGQVQYRAMLWNENENRYVDLWNTKDFYYDKWKPRGKDVFTISLPITKPGKYRIKVFAKRSGVANSKGVLKGMNCDSYLYDIPFRINS